MHTEDPIVFTIFLIFTGAAVLATVALYVRQALLVAYILLGVLLGPSVSGVVNDAEMIREIAHIGIMFLLFLMGLELNPRGLLLMMLSTLFNASYLPFVVFAYRLDRPLVRSFP